MHTRWRSERKVGTHRCMPSLNRAWQSERGGGGLCLSHVYTHTHTQFVGQTLMKCSRKSSGLSVSGPLLCWSTGGWKNPQNKSQVIITWVLGSKHLFADPLSALSIRCFLGLFFHCFFVFPFPPPPLAVACSLWRES